MHDRCAEFGDNDARRLIGDAYGGREIGAGAEQRSQRRNNRIPGAGG